MARAPFDIKSRNFPTSVGKERTQLGPGSPAPSGREALKVAGQVVFPPSIYPPKEGRGIFVEGNQAALTAANTPVVLARFQVPPNDVGFIREVSLVINNMLITTNIIFTLRQDGGGISGYTNMRVSPRAAASVSATLPAENTVIFINDGALIELVATVVDAGTYQLGATFRGWHLPKKIAEQYPRL